MSSVVGGVGFAVKTVVDAPEGAVAQLFRRHCQMLERQVVPERVMGQLHAGMVMIGGLCLAQLQPLFGHRIHLVGIPPTGSPLFIGASHSCSDPELAVEDRASCKDEPTQDGHAGQGGGNRMTEKGGSAHGTSERGQVGQDVVYRSDEPSVEDMRDSNEKTTGEGYGQQKTHHVRSLADSK